MQAVKELYGRVSYVRRFMPALAEMLLDKLLKKDVSFRWDEEQQAAFQKVKNVLRVSPTMIQPVKSLQLTLYLTSTNKSIGALAPIYYGTNIIRG